MSEEVLRTVKERLLVALRSFLYEEAVDFVGGQLELQEGVTVEEALRRFSVTVAARLDEMDDDAYGTAILNAFISVLLYLDVEYDLSPDEDGVEPEKDESVEDGGSGPGMMFS